MNYAEIENILLKEREIYKELSKQARECYRKIEDLKSKKEKMESDLFLEYISLNEPFEFSRYTYLSGVQVNLKETPTLNNGSHNWSCNFSTGDIIQVIKKNKRSVIIECISKNVSKYENGKKVVNVVTPKSQFRVNIDNYRSCMLQDKNFHESFKTWIKRKNSLDSILD